MGKNDNYKHFFRRIMTVIKSQMKDGKLDEKALDMVEIRFYKALETHKMGCLKAKRDKNGICYHPETKIVFDFDNPLAHAIGVYNDGKVNPLTYDDVMICVMARWIFDDSKVRECDQKSIFEHKEVKKYAKSKIDL